jgi:hypothetical protein
MTQNPVATELFDQTTIIPTKKYSAEKIRVLAAVVTLLGYAIPTKTVKGPSPGRSNEGLQLPKVKQPNRPWWENGGQRSDAEVTTL